MYILAARTCSVATDFPIDRAFPNAGWQRTCIVVCATTTCIFQTAVGVLAKRQWWYLSREVVVAQPQRLQFR